MSCRKNSGHNILYIMTDQQRYDSLSLTGMGICRTPHLDRLAVAGVNFSRAYSVCALCTPARASMLTGLYPHNHKLLINNDTHASSPDEFPDDIRLISQDLAAAGYNCGYSGKWHCGTRKLPSTYAFQGMDVPEYGRVYKTPEYLEYIARRGLKRPEVVEYIPETAASQPRLTGAAGAFSGPPEACEPYFVAEYALDLLRKFSAETAAGGRPFMLFVSFWGPHHPCYVPEPYASMYPPAEVKLWDNFDDDLSGRPNLIRKFGASIYPGGKSLDPETWRKMIAKYWGYCTFIDAQIGRLLAALDELKLAGHTAVMFSTDHGDTLGCHGRMWDKDSFMFEETYHIPLMLRIPWMETCGAGCNRFVLNMDLAATALDLAGVKPARRHDGRSLVPLAANPQAPWSDDVMCEFHGHRFPSTHRMLRWDKFKYVFNAGDFDELYDLENDPAEMRNLIADPAHAGIADECRRRLLQWINNTGDIMELTAVDYLNTEAAVAGFAARA